MRYTGHLLLRRSWVSSCQNDMSYSRREAPEGSVVRVWWPISSEEGQREPFFKSSSTKLLQSVMRVESRDERRAGGTCDPHRNSERAKQAQYPLRIGMFAVQIDQRRTTCRRC